jgi:hypothetical protein
MIYFLLFIQYTQKFFASFLGVLVFILISVLLFLIMVMDMGNEDLLSFIKKYKRLFATWFIFFTVSLLVVCSPTLDDVVKMRISLIKYQLLSPQNVQSGIDTINRIGKELENKYLKGDNK